MMTGKQTPLTEQDWHRTGSGVRCLQCAQVGVWLAGFGVVREGAPG